MHVQPETNGASWSSWIGTISQYLPANAFKDMERTALTVMSVANYAFALISFLGASFMSAGFYLISGAAFAYGARTLQRFANWSYHLTETGKHVNSLSITGFQLRKENKALEEHLIRFQDMLREHAEHNAVQEALTGKLAQVAGQNAESLQVLDALIEKSTGADREVLEQQRELTALAVKANTNATLIAEMQSRLNLNFQEIAEQTDRCLQALAAASPELKAEVTALQNVRRGLEQGVTRLDGAASRIERGAEQVASAAQTAAAAPIAMHLASRNLSTFSSKVA